MKKRCLLAVLLLAFFHLEIVGQSFNELNALPPTIEVDATEFNTVKNYSFQVDTKNNSLLIQDLRLSKEGLVHYNQWMYEIPLNDLHKNSLRITKNNFNQINLQINCGKNSILTYKFVDNKVTNIRTSNSLVLGNWPYQKETEDELNSIINIVAEKLPTGNSEVIDYTRIRKVGTSLYRSVENSKNKTHYNPTIVNGYSLVTQSKSFKPLIKELKKLVKKRKSKLPIPVVIYLNEKGVVESIYIHNNQKVPLENINLSKYFVSEKIGLAEQKMTPSKYIFLLEN